jgi:Fic family protein
MREKQQKILHLLLEIGPLSSSAIHTELVKEGTEVSLVTVKRTLSNILKLGLVASEGAGPAITYRISVKGRLGAEIDARGYCAIEPDQRYGMRYYNAEFLSALPSDFFSDHDLQTIEEATREYRRRTADISETIQKKELERLVIELSWKSSRIEGNTYTLFDAEKLILKHKEAAGHSKEEAQMILNHQDAFAFAHTHRDVFKTLTRANLEHLHSLLVKDLDVGKGFRQRPVGVLGSIYQPIDHIHQINDAVDDLVHAVAKMKTPYAKALVAFLGISYIQPFEDGNKRTSRLMANALLMAQARAPLSYRSVDENEYREAMLVFYELNSIIPMKNIFVAQYDFAARNYAVK